MQIELPTEHEGEGVTSPAMLYAPLGQVDEAEPTVEDVAAEDERVEMSDDELLATLGAMEADAITAMELDASDTRSTVMEYFFGLPLGNEELGRSQAISTDVMDGILGMLPDILEPFVASDEVVEFEPESAKDEEGAAQETAYINKVLERNDKFAFLYQWVFEGLAQTNGVVQYAWDKVQQVQIERYEGLTQAQMMMLASDPSVEVLEHRAEPLPGWQPDPMQPMTAPPMMHDAVVRERRGTGRPALFNVPPEEFIISSDATSWNPKRATMCGRRREITVSQLRQMGFEVDDDAPDSDGDILRSSAEFLARHVNSLAFGDLPDDGGAGRKLLVRDYYPLIDFDGDGIAERRRVMYVGTQILLNEEVEEPPFSAWTPYIIPHRYLGVCPGEQLLDVQVQKTALVRMSLDSVYQANQGRHLVARGVDWDDLMNNPVGGFIKVEADNVAGKVQEISSTPVHQITLPMIEYLDAAKESRTGYSKQAAGLDANAIRQMTAFGAAEVTDAARKRAKMIARTFAETGLKDLMISLHGLVKRNATQPDVVKLRGQYIDVDPRNWRTRTAMTVNVGLGTGSKQVTLQGLQFLLTAQKEALQIGLSTPTHVYNALAEVTRALGFKNTHKFWQNPSEPGAKPPPQKPDPAIEAAKIQAEGLVRAEGVKAQSSERKAAKQDQTKYLIALLEQATKALIAAAQENDAETFEPQQRAVQGEMRRLGVNDGRS